MKTAVFWCSLLTVVVFSLMPTTYLPPPMLSLWDKLEHATAFAVLTVLGVRAYELRPLRVVLGLILLGGLIEVVQAATGWRNGEWLDLLADSFGIAAALGLMFYGRKLHAHRSVVTE